ncbi:hypothetical protein D1AOALGA4SA_4550 [Olavius algarvensis Delta 1 endosymbiont]|nr:hypothetical protein D1AOALGA4SA_4550 [Olavius algarvensis Delta 1 endosymbiont]
MIPCSIFDIRFFEVSFIDQTGRSFGQKQRSYETTFKANRRISNIEPQNVEGWNRFALPI